jgi:hypothetical protein
MSLFQVGLGFHRKPLRKLDKSVGFADLWKRSPNGDRVERPDRMVVPLPKRRGMAA